LPKKEAIMKFNPHYFIILAQRAGVELTRYDKTHIHIESHGKLVPVLWQTVAKRHKKQLLKYLPDHKIQRIQTNLFDACDVNPWDYLKR